MKKYILAHDIGTTGNKATLFDLNGKLIESCYETYNTFYPKPFCAEQKPMDWWDAFYKSTRSLLNITNISPNEIEVVSFSGQMMGAIPVDKNGNLLRENVLIWSDGRPSIQAKRLLEGLGGWENFYNITGGGLSVENYPISKILWYKENEPEIYKKTFNFLHTKDFIINRLTGNFCTDYTDASNSGYLDINKRKYSLEILDIAGISIDKLPNIYKSFEVVGKVSNSAAELTGLPKGLPVVEGAGDVAAATFGAGVIGPGIGYIYIGSANWTGVYSQKPIFDTETRPVNLCHVIPNVYAPHHTAYTGGSAQQWYKDTFCEMEIFTAKNTGLNVYDLLELKAAKLEPGSGNIIFIPLLRGGGAPFHNPKSKGSFIGLTLASKKEQLFRAVLEGVALNFGIIIDNFERKNILMNEFKAIGGGAKSKLWLQIFSDVIGKKISTTSYLQEANTLGVAVAGGIGVGIFKDENVLNEILKDKDVFMQNPKSVKKYKELKKIFLKAYKGLEETFNLLSEISE